MKREFGGMKEAVKKPLLFVFFMLLSRSACIIISYGACSKFNELFVKFF